MEVKGTEQDNDEVLYDKLELSLDEKKKKDAWFLLQTKETNRLTQKATSNVMDNVTTLVRNTVEILRMGVQNRLDSAGLRFDAVPGLTDTCGTCGFFLLLAIHSHEGMLLPHNTIKVKKHICLFVSLF